MEHLDEMALEHGIGCDERRVSLMELHTADEVFTTGTMGELAHVVEIDGRRIGPPEAGSSAGPVTRRLQDIYARRTASEGALLPF